MLDHSWVVRALVKWRAIDKDHGTDDEDGRVALQQLRYVADRLTMIESWHEAKDRHP
jgi:hypothetical protein